MKRASLLPSFLLLPPMLAASVLPGTAGPMAVTRPPVTVSTDLTEPWLVQMKPGQRRAAVSYPDARQVPGQVAGQVSGQVPGQIGFFSTPLRTASATPTAPVPSASLPPSQQTDPAFLPALVTYPTKEAPGTIVIDTNARYLYLVLGDGKAQRYGVGVGRPGFEWAGVHRVTRKAEWPDWRPPAAMMVRERKRGRILPSMMAGGPNNPLGARAMYLGSTEYRIHGSNEPWSIGHAVSSGCIRMRNEDVIDLYSRVKVGTKVIVS